MSSVDKCKEQWVSDLMLYVVKFPEVSVEIQVILFVKSQWKVMKILQYSSSTTFEEKLFVNKIFLREK